MNASALPDPKEVSYDVLLRYVDISVYPFVCGGEFRVASIVYSRILAYLNLYGTWCIPAECLAIPTGYTVESDYTVVFFAAGGRHTPGWNWVWKAYRSLSRKYRKNLKKLVSDPHSNKLSRPF